MDAQLEHTVIGHYIGEHNDAKSERTSFTVNFSTVNDKAVTLTIPQINDKTQATNDGTKKIYKNTLYDENNVEIGYTEVIEQPGNLVISVEVTDDDMIARLEQVEDERELNEKIMRGEADA